MSQGIMLVTKDLQIPIINRDAASFCTCPGSSSIIRPGFDQIVAVSAAS